MAWQFNCPEKQAGAVQVFRRAGSPYEKAHLKLHDLEAKAKYEVRNFAQDSWTLMSGERLMTEGMELTIEEAPRAVNIVYRKVEL